MGGGNLVTQYVYGNSVETFVVETEVPLGKQPAFFSRENHLVFTPVF